MTATTTKRRASGSSSACYYYAHSHDHDGASSPTKRRRRREEEPRHDAALADARRPRPRPVPSRRRGGRAPSPGSRSESLDNAEGARVMTSSEYDRNEAEAEAEASNDDDNKTQVEGGRAGEEEGGSESRDYGYDDVSSMYMMAGLIRSTRNYYGFPECDTKTVSSPARCNDPRASGRIDATQVYSNYGNGYNNEKAPSEDNSEGLSTWTPSSSCGDLDDSDRKRIDDDNRSDGQSSDGAGGDSPSDGISSFDPSLLKGEDEIMLDSLGSIVKTTTGGAFSIIG